MDHLLRIQQEPVTIFTAIESGDKDGARNAMRTHLADTCERIFNGPNGPKLLVEGRIF